MLSDKESSSTFDIKSQKSEDNDTQLEMIHQDDTSQVSTIQKSTNDETKNNLNDQQITNESLDLLLNDVNYAVILEFISKFGENLQINDITYKNFENNLLNKKTVSRKLLDLQLNLLKKLSYGRNAKKEKWEHYFTRFAYKYSKSDGKHLEENGYLESDVHVKLRLLKNLLEFQFDDNLKLKQILSELETSKLRSQPSGRDIDGYDYWIFMDKEFTIRIFTQHSEDQNGLNWKVVAKNLDDLKQLYEKLSTHSCMEKFKNEQTETKPDVNTEKTEEISKNEEKVEAKEEIKQEECTVETKQEIEKIKDEPVNEINGNHQEIKEETENSKEEIKTENEEIIKNESDLTLLESNKNNDEEDKNPPPDGDLFEPIALRRPKRTSAIKKPNPDDIYSSPKTASSNKKPQTPSTNKKTPQKRVQKRQSLSNEASSEDDIPLAKLKNKRKSDDDFKPSSKSKSKSKKKPKSESENSSDDDDDDGDDESKCKKCLKFKEKELLILCDGCDDAYHIKCLSLIDVPEGNWYCPACDHRNLCTKLKEKIETIEAHFKELEAAKKQSIKNRSNRIADIGANLDNLFNNKPKKPRVPKPKVEKPKVNVFIEAENLGTRSCRLKKVKYTFDEYDKSIKEAMGDEENIENVEEDDVDEESSRKKRRRRGESDEDEEFTTNRNKKSSFSDDDLTPNEDENDDDDDVEDKFSDNEFKPIVRRKSKRVIKRKRYSDDDDFEVDERALQFSGRRSERRKNVSTYRELSESDNDDDDELKTQKRKNTGRKRKDSDYESELDDVDENESDDYENSQDKEEVIFKPSKTPNKISRIKRPIDSESDEKLSIKKNDSGEEWKSEDSDSDVATKLKQKTKSIIKKPWEDDNNSNLKSNNSNENESSHNSDEEKEVGKGNEPQLPIQLSTYGSSSPYVPDSYKPFSIPTTVISSSNQQQQNTIQTFDYSEQNL